MDNTTKPRTYFITVQDDNFLDRNLYRVKNLLSSKMPNLWGRIWAEFNSCSVKEENLESMYKRLAQMATEKSEASKNLTEADYKIESLVNVTKGRGGVLIVRVLGYVKLVLTPIIKDWKPAN